MFCQTIEFLEHEKFLINLGLILSCFLFMEVFADGFVADGFVVLFFKLRTSSMLFVYVLYAIRHVWHAKSTKNELK